MLLLDKNAEPKKTIFYLSAIAHGLILKKIVNIESLYIELQKEIEDRLSEALLGGEIRLGDHVTVGASKGKITLNVRGPKKETVGSL